MGIIEWKTSDRGFVLGVFRDHNTKYCSIQESSIATEYLIWLGLDKLQMRMHLSQETVKALLPALTYFAEHGRLPQPERKWCCDVMREYQERHGFISMTSDGRFFREPMFCFHCGAKQEL